MEKEGGNREKMRKCRESISLNFLILSPFPLCFLFISSFSLHFLAARLPHVVQPWGSINVPGKKWPYWSLDIHPAKGWHQCSVWRAWRLSDKKCPLSRRAFKGVRFCDRRRYWRSSHSLSSAPNFIAMTPLLYNILGAITISLYLAISNNIFTLFGNIKQYLYLALSNIIFLFGTLKQYINQSL